MNDELTDLLLSAIDDEPNPLTAEAVEFAEATINLDDEPISPGI